MAGQNVVDPKTLDEERFIFEAKIAGNSIARAAVLASTYFGYPISAATAHVRLKSAYARASQEALFDIAEVRLTEAEKLDAQERRVRQDLRVYELEYDGTTRLDPNMRPVERDPKIRLNAEAMLLRIAERRAKLLGLDAPAQVEVTHAVVDPADLELRRLIDDARAQSDAPYPTKENES